MPLDLMLGNNQNDADLAGSINELLHEQIFYRPGLPDRSFPQFNKLKDYYSDAVFRVEELESLAGEIALLKTHFANNPVLHKEICNIGDVCQKAIDQQVVLWAFCD